MAISLSEVQRLNEWRRVTLEMLSDPSTWPAWPVLPLKKYGAKDALFPYTCGVVIDSEDVRSTVFIENMYMLPRSLAKIKENVKANKYKNCEDIVKAGWLVD